MAAPLPPAVLAFHRELGIPDDYAAVRHLPFQPEAAPDSLVDIGCHPDGRRLQLAAPAAVAWRRLQAAAARDGLPLIALSAFRSVPRQAALIREKLRAGRALPEILRYVAAPGFSEHHTGRALDLADPDHPELEEDFAGTAAFRWLQTHASSHGFLLSYPRDHLSGIGYEPWHWCWHPPADSAGGPGGDPAR